MTLYISLADALVMDRRNEGSWDSPGTWDDPGRHGRFAAIEGGENNGLQSEINDASVCYTLNLLFPAQDATDVHNTTHSTENKTFKNPLFSGKKCLTV